MLSQIIEEHLAPDDASDLERDVLHDTDPAQALAALSATASLLVLGAASRRPDGEGVLGDTTRGLVVRARCPLAVVPQHADLYRVTRPRAA